MKLLLLLVAIYSMIYHQSRKVEELTLNAPVKNTESNYPLRWSEETGYNDGYLFSDFRTGSIELKPERKSVYQQKQTQDRRYPFYQPFLSKGN